MTKLNTRAVTRLAGVCVALGLALATTSQTQAATSPAAATAGAAHSSVSSPSSVACNNYGFIHASNTNYVMDATGFNDPTNVQINSFNGGLNQQWTECLAGNNNGDNYYFFEAQYQIDGQGALLPMCLNVDGANYASGTQIRATNCPLASYGEVSENEKFYAVAMNGQFRIRPIAQQSLCMNAKGGINDHALVILYACNNQNNELWDWL